MKMTPISKAALIANSADLVRQARRELDGADAYVASQRSVIARRLHAPTEAARPMARAEPIATSPPPTTEVEPS